MRYIQLLLTLTLIIFHLNVFADVNNLCSQNLSPKSEIKLSQQQFNTHVDFKNFTVATYNALNLNAFVGKWDYDKDGNYVLIQTGRSKPAWAREKLAQTIIDLNADVLCLQEVEGIDVAEQFNKRYLNDQYVTLGTRGNDSRGIQIIFYIKKALLDHVNIKMRSFKNETWIDPTKPQIGEQKLFSRDLLTLELRNIDTPEDSPPNLVLFGTHLKSKRDRPGDKQSKIKRGAQVQRTVEIIKDYQKKYGEDLAIIELGDHNGAFNFESEFAPLIEDSGLINVMNFSEISVVLSDRITHTYHPRDEIDRFQEIDGIFFTESLATKINSSEVIPYKNNRGQKLSFARTKAQRDKQPSDHRPVKAIFNFEFLFPQ